MKTKFLITICVLFVSTITLFGQKKDIIRHVSMDSIDNTKEYVVTAYDKKNSKALYKSIYQYNKYDTTRTTYLWRDSKGWVEVHKYEYICNTDNKLVYIIYTKWDNNANKWADISELSINLYDRDNKFVATQKVEMDNRDREVLFLE